jgi:hypothetical protein
LGCFWLESQQLAKRINDLQQRGPESYREFFAMMQRILQSLQGYTASDCIGWMQAVGFHQPSLQELPGGNSMVIGVK